MNYREPSSCDLQGEPRYAPFIVYLDEVADLLAQIMMGVHGNGLTSLLWMKPTPRSTVIEFFYPGGFAHDYEYTTRALGMTHYGFWGNRYVSLI